MKAKLQATTLGESLGKLMEVTLNENLINMPPNSENCVDVYLVTQTMRSLKSNYLQMATQSVMLSDYGFKCEYINGAGGCAYYIFWYMH